MHIVYTARMQGT